MEITTGLTSVGAIGGIAYAVSKNKSFWTTASTATPTYICVFLFIICILKI